MKEEVKAGLEALGYNAARYVEMIDEELKHGGSRRIRAMTFAFTYLYGISKATASRLPSSLNDSENLEDTPEVKALIGEDDDEA